MPLLGNIVISKKFLRTRKIMVMHRNKRGECCPRTLVDHKRKRYDKAVDVVVRLHDRPILSPKVRHAGKQYDLYRPQLTCVLLVHITSTHKPGSDATVGERRNFKKIPTHTQDHGDA